MSTFTLTCTSSLGNGDCFFDSIRIILASAGINTTVRKLRQMVASSLLNKKDSAANAALLQWAQLYADAVKEGNVGLQTEYQHMAVLFPPGGGPVSFPLKSRFRKLVAHEILKSSFYGEQYSLDVMERNLQINLIVMTGDGTLVQRPMSRLANRGLAFLTLNCIHYQPMHCRGKYLFQWRELPLPIRRILRHFKQIYY